MQIQTIKNNFNNQHQSFKMNLVSVPSENQRFFEKLKNSIFHIGPDDDAFLSRENFHGALTYVLKCGTEQATTTDLMSVNVLQKLARNIADKLGY